MQTRNEAMRPRVMSAGIQQPPARGWQKVKEVMLPKLARAQAAADKPEPSLLEIVKAEQVRLLHVLFFSLPPSASNALDFCMLSRRPG
jgi:hypothetical protein